MALGTLNQLIWRPAFTVDLTLRRGNGGFILLGLCCVVASLALPKILDRRVTPRGRVG